MRRRSGWCGSCSRQQAGIEGCHRRPRVSTTRREPTALPVLDLVTRSFTASAPDRLGASDITYIPSWPSFLYLAVVLDAFSRRVVGWAMADHLRTELVLAALDLGLEPQTRSRRHSSLRPRVHVPRFRAPLSGSERLSLDGLGRRLLRQRSRRELFRHTGVRATRSPALQAPDRSSSGNLRLH